MKWIKITKNNFKCSCEYSKSNDYAKLENFIINNNIVYYRDDIGKCYSILHFFQNKGFSRGKNEILISKYCNIEFADHYKFFKNSVGDIFFVSQPFSSNEDIKKEFTKYFDNNFKLNIYDTNKSWYMPNNTIIFVVTLTKTIVKL